MFLKFVFNTIKKFNPAIFIGFVFFVLPFFWFSPGAIDIGGDGTRLYFYDPGEFLKNVTVYAPTPEGKGDIDPAKHAYLIYVAFLACVHFFLKSPYLLISVFTGIKLSVGFLSIYFIVKEIILGYKYNDNNTFKLELAAILAGIFYIISTASEKLIFFWEKPLFSHDQIFLNPLMFFLLLRFFLTRKWRYLLSVLFLSFVFSANFAMIASPAFFSFYPLTVVFLLLYVIFIRKKKIFLRDLFFALITFLGLHAFHLLPEIATVLDKGSVTNTVVFKDVVKGGVNFFIAIRGEGKASMSFFLPSPDTFLKWTAFVGPLVVISGFLLGKIKRKELWLNSLFFFITFFLVSVNITDIGYQFYQNLFYIPGFSIFRHFFVQWAFVFIFFYALLFGQCLFLIFSKLKTKYVKIITLSILILFIIGFWNFLNGKLVDGIQWGSKNVKSAMIMDPKYEQTLEFLRSLPGEGKIVLFPLTSFYHQIIHGTNNAAYVGPTSISYLTPKKSFAGYQNFYPYPIPEEMMRFAKEKNYDALTQLFSLFNIRYIFHNTDTKVYEEKFPLFPNDYMMTAFPKTQKEYKRFVQSFPVSTIYRNGSYEIFEFNEKVYRPEVYIPDSLYIDDMVNIISKKEISYRAAFIEKSECEKNSITSDFCKKNYKPPKVSIRIEKINPTQYIIHITQSKSNSPFLLAFQNSFHTGWKLKFDSKNSISEDKHVLVNAYANGWIITPDDRKEKNEYTMILTLETQKYFWYGLYITCFSVISFLVVGFVISKRNFF